MFEQTLKNLANARELFVSHLNSTFTRRGEGWIETKLIDICNIKHGFAFKSQFFVEKSDYVVLTPGSFFESGGFREQGKKTKYYQGEIPDGYLLEKGDFLIAMTEQAVGLLGSSLIVPEPNKYLHNQRLGLVELIDGVVWDNDFFFHQFNTRQFRDAVQASASGVKVRHTSPTKLGDINICFPTLIEEQKEVADKLNALRDETRKLETLYRDKFTSLAELKQSLLQKAFSGELTANEVIATSKAIEAETTPTELTASIIALAYHRHAAKKRDKTFGRVKAQKVLHLVESIGGVDLGRAPIKDAAGPNDFQHMLSAEDWARRNQFFAFTEKKTGKGYDFKKLKSYDQFLVDALNMTKLYSMELDRIIDLVLPMNSSEAEVFATVHAAWNNLMLDRLPITDDMIIREARENWHPDKTRIPVSKFRDAIRLIRDKGLVPDGRAKRVGGQEFMF